LEWKIKSVNSVASQNGAVVSLALLKLVELAVTSVQQAKQVVFATSTPVSV
jgi:hypothetical protein